MSRSMHESEWKGPKSFIIDPAVIIIDPADPAVINTHTPVSIT
jgi:hypothetical protein